MNMSKPFILRPVATSLLMLAMLIAGMLAKAKAGEPVDFVADFARPLPQRVMASVLGFPLEDADIFRGFVHNVLEAVNLAPGARMEAFAELDRYIVGQAVPEVAPGTAMMNLTLEQAMDIVEKADLPAHVKEAQIGRKGDHVVGVEVRHGEGQQAAGHDLLEVLRIHDGVSCLRLLFGKAAHFSRLGSQSEKAGT